MSIGNDELLSKAAFVTDVLTAGGLLLAEQDKFIDMVIEASIIAKDARVIKMNSPKRLVEKIGFGSRILRAAVESIAPTGTSVPTTGKVELDTVELIAAVDVSYSTLEDNIDRAALKDKLMRQIAERAAVDLEELYLQGDEDSATDPLFLLDGWMLQATTHTVLTSACSTCTQVLSTVMKAMPAKYKRIKKNLKFYVSNDFVESYILEIAARQTALGDALLTEGGNPKFGSCEVVGVDMMPAKHVLYTDPQNLLVGIQRAITLETDVNQRKRVVEITLTCRVDAKCEEEAALVVTHDSAIS